MDLALNNLQGLICHKTQQTKPSYSGSFFVPFHREYCHFSILKPRSSGFYSVLRAGWLISVQPEEKLSTDFSAGTS